MAVISRLLSLTEFKNAGLVTKLLFGFLSGKIDNAAPYYITFTSPGVVATCWNQQRNGSELSERIVAFEIRSTTETSSVRV
jgi:hypothetical protein